MTNLTVQAAEAMREAAAKVAEGAYNLMFPKPGNRIVAQNAGMAAARAIRALPLPEPALDQCDAAEAMREAQITALREFVRSARGIIQHYARANPKHIWGGREIDPQGAHTWLATEAAEIGTMRDGWNPKVRAPT